MFHVFSVCLIIFRRQRISWKSVLGPRESTMFQDLALQENTVWHYLPCLFLIPIVEFLNELRGGFGFHVGAFLG